MNEGVTQTERLPRIWVPYFVLLVSLLMSLVAAAYVVMSADKQDQAWVDKLGLYTVAGGLVVSGSLFLATMLQARARRAAERTAIELRRSDAALRQSERRYRSLIDASAQVVWTTSADGHVIDDLPAWREFTGQTREQLSGRGWLTAVHPDDRQHVISVWDRSLVTQTPHELEFRVRTVNGAWRTVVSRAAPVFDAGGKLCEWVGAVADVTSARRAEAATRFLSEASAALASSLDYQATLQTLAQSAVPRLADWCAVDVLDEAGIPQRLAVAHVDPAKARWARELQELHPPDMTADRGLPRVLRTGQVEHYPSITEEMLVSAARDKEHLAILHQLNMVSAIVAPLTARGRILGAITLIGAESGHHYTAEDVVYAEELGRRAGMAIDNARLYAEARKASRTKDELLATVSHELRTPVNSILGWAQLLQAGPVDAESVRESAEMIERNARMLGQRICDLLDSTRITSGSLTIEHRRVDLASAVSEAVAEAEPLAAAKHLRLTRRLDSDAGTVMGDAARLQQIAAYLLNNAVKFTPEFGAVEVVLSRTNGKAELRVSDSGRGISADFLPHIFEGLRQADASSTRQHGGLGLGLAITRHLVELHGGSLAAISEGEGRGSTFTVLLPLASPAEPDEQVVVGAAAGRLDTPEDAHR